MLRICSALVLLAGMAAAGPEGRVRVIDGDTVEVGETRVRLFGIDAPEIDQTCTLDGQPWRCGEWAAGESHALFHGTTARCEEKDRDRYGRVVATCRVGATDMGRKLVEEGIALAYRRYSWDYDLVEKAAAIAGRGVHRAEMRAPSDHRASKNATTETGPNGCTIKGNISGDGKRIYHRPGQEHYARTRISTAKGERWFCSEAEAQAAGWRAARR